MEPPLCASPHHLSGLTVARLRLAQLVSFEEKKNIFKIPYNTNERPAPPHWLSRVWMWCRCREPPTPPLTVGFCLTLRPRSSSPSSPRTSSSTPSLTETTLLFYVVREGGRVEKTTQVDWNIFHHLSWSGDLASCICWSEGKTRRGGGPHLPHTGGNLVQGSHD